MDNTKSIDQEIQRCFKMDSVQMKIDSTQMIAETIFTAMRDMGIGVGHPECVAAKHRLQGIDLRVIINDSSNECQQDAIDTILLDDDAMYKVDADYEFCGDPEGAVERAVRDLWTDDEWSK